MAAAGRHVGVVGAGWAGLAAAVRLVQSGHAVTVFEMAREPGGRARSIERGGTWFDNGQHILIGAYASTLDLMRTVGVKLEEVLLRMPLTLRYPDGRALVLPEGRPLLALLRGLAGARGLGWRGRAALLLAAAGWARRGFACDPSWTVDRLCRGLPASVRRLLIDPLCVAALNTPAAEASAAVFLRVLRDALLSGPGSADLLLPRRPLAELLPLPAWRWLAQHGATLRAGHRVQALAKIGAGWRLDGEEFDAVVLACTAAEAARLTAGHAPPGWCDAALAMPYEPIVTVYLDAPGARLPSPMLALVEGADAPAQFVFDHGAIAGPGGAAGRNGLLACVVSGARRWVERGLDATADTALAQARRELAPWLGAAPPRVLHTLSEKRATFRCIPGLARPPMHLAAGLLAAGDYIEGPYPATLEGAVRSGIAAAAALAAGRPDGRTPDARMPRHLLAEAREAAPRA